MDDPTELDELGGAAKRIGTSNAAEKVADRLWELAERRRSKLSPECV